MSAVGRSLDSGSDRPSRSRDFTTAIAIVPRRRKRAVSRSLRGVPNNASTSHREEHLVGG